MSKLNDSMRIRFNLSPVTGHTQVLTMVSPFLYKQNTLSNGKSNESKGNDESIANVEKIVVDENLIDIVLGPPKNQTLSPKEHLQGSGLY